MPLNNNSMDDIGYLQKSGNGNPLTGIIKMVQFLLLLTITAMAVMAIQFYTSIK
jgi:hypothetical protein